MVSSPPPRTKSAALKSPAAIAFAKKGLLRRYLERPQQVWFRRACRQIHLWAGVLVALYIIAIGVSGSILVFKDELMPRPRYAGPAPDVAHCRPADLLGAMQTAAAAFPMREVVVASCPTEANPFFAINLRQPGPAPRDEITALVDPATLRLAAAVEQDASWVGWVYRFHVNLLLLRNGRQWNGVGAFILVLLVATGLVLWWPGIRNWARGFKISLRSHWKRINWDLHSAIGIWTVCFTLVWATTGVYFAWPAPFHRAVRTLSRITTAEYPAEQMATLAQRSVDPSAPPLRLASVLETAQTQSPGAHLEGLFYGSGSKAILTVYMARKRVGDYATTDFLYFDQHTGRLLYVWRRGQNHTLGDWLLWSFTPLHFGTSWGLAAKVVWALLGLALPLLTVTGLILYWNRSLRKWFRHMGLRKSTKRGAWNTSNML